MNKIFTLLLLGATIALTACETADPSANWFNRPEVTVTGTTAVVSCTTNFADGVLSEATAGFLFVPIAGGEPIDLTTPQIAGSTLTGTQTGLSSETLYRVYAYVKVGSERMQSNPAGFITGTSDGTDPNPDPDSPTFGSPVASDVTASTATLNCQFTFGEITDYTLYFRYKAASSTNYTTVEVDASAGMKTTTLTGLAASTTYEFALCAERNGKSYKSNSGSFTTASESGGGATGGAKYSGWAELPAENRSNSDYYYAYHITDVKAPNGKYARNYGVCYSNSLKCAIWVAAPMHTFYSEKNTNRTNAYKADPTISISQPGKWTGYTRGHMLGSGERLVSRKTNEQVFYYSNIAPQLQTYFNTGGGAWNTIEDWVDTQWTQSADTTYQVIGCYWANKNKKVAGTTIPTHYYKILLRTKGHKNKWVANCSRDELQCIAVMVEHRTYSKGEVAKPSEYESRGMLHSVREMEQLTGQTFFANIPNAPKDTYNTSDWGL